MGLGKLNRSVLLEDTPEIRGMVNKVCHLVCMEEVKGEKG
jgi:large subunit ribosomal protein L30